MKKILIITALLFAASTALLTACDEEEQTYQRPQFGAITYTPHPAIVGDTIELVIPHKVKGNGIAATTYTWTIRNIGYDAETGASKDTIVAVMDNYDGLGKCDPHLKLCLPDDCPVGYHEVTMRATFSVYIGATLFDETNVRGSITVENPS